VFFEVVEFVLIEDCCEVYVVVVLVVLVGIVVVDVICGLSFGKWSCG